MSDHIDASARSADAADAAAHLDPGDAWATGPEGERRWGRFGAAGLLVHDAARGVLLQHRAAWSHEGGTWALPGGARHAGESALAAAYREAGEEAGVPADVVSPRYQHLHDLGWWSYVSVVASVSTAFEPISDGRESAELRWVPRAEVLALPLHPGFLTTWPTLNAWLDRDTVLVVDVANVLGSVPDGWWRDRADATAALVQRIRTAVAAGMPGALLGSDAAVVHPRVVCVVEGAAREGVAVGSDVVHAAGSGDDAVVGVAATIGGGDVVVVTSDRALAARVAALGARIVGARTLRAALPELPR